MEILEALSATAGPAAAVPQYATALSQALIAQPTDPIVQALREALIDRHLVLVLGAGVSIAAGLPDWDRLLNRVLGTALTRVLSTATPASGPEALAKLYRRQVVSSPLVLARHAKRLLGATFGATVRAELYRDRRRDAPLLPAIERLVATGRVHSVVTLNFDDLVERELGRAGIRSQAIFGAGQVAGSDLPVYHVHGFLPETDPPADSPLVFSEAEYNEGSYDPYRWSALVLLGHLTQHTCLFIGVSSQDPDLRQLMQAAKTRGAGIIRQHFIVRRRTSRDDVRRSLRRRSISTAQLDEVGRALDWVDAAGLDELGITPLWVDNYDEVPATLDQLTAAAAVIA